MVGKDDSGSERYLSELFVVTLVPTNYNLVQNVVQTYQFDSTIEYNRLTQNS